MPTIRTYQIKVIGCKVTLGRACGPVVFTGIAAKRDQAEQEVIPKAATAVCEAQDIAGVLYKIVKAQNAPNDQDATINQGSKAQGRNKLSMITQPTMPNTQASNSIRPLSNGIRTAPTGQVKQKIDPSPLVKNSINYAENVVWGPITYFKAIKTTER